MSVIEITAAQANALAALTDRQGLVAIHQVEPGGDIYVTPRGSSSGYRISSDGILTDIGETLPAPS